MVESLVIDRIRRRLVEVAVLPILVSYNPLTVVVGVSLKRLEMSVGQAVRVFVNNHTAFECRHLIARYHQTVKTVVFDNIAGGEQKEIVGIL